MSREFKTFTTGPWHMNIWESAEDTFSLSANNQCIFKIIPFCLYLSLRLFFFKCASGAGAGLRAHKCRCWWKPEEGIGSFTTGVRGHCEPADTDAGKRTWLFCKSSISSPTTRLALSPGPSTCFISII